MKLSHQTQPNPAGTQDVATQKFVTNTISTPLAGGLEFLDKITVTSNVTSVTFSATGDGQYKHDLNGNVDEIYVINFRFLKGGTALLDLRPNGLTSNLSREVVNGDTNTITDTTAANWVFTGSGGNFDRFNGTLRLDARTGMPRPISVEVTDMDVGAGDVRFSAQRGMWDNTTTNITSLQIVSNQASTILSGSVFELYRLRSVLPVTMTKGLGGLEFMDKIVVSANTSSVTFGAAGNGLFLREIDGNVDEEYICRYHIKQNGSTPQFVMRPNGVSTNQSGEQIAGAAGANSAQTRTDFRIGGLNTDCEGHVGEFTFQARTGIGPRQFRNFHGAYDTTSFDQINNVLQVASWNETSTNVTSLVIVDNTTANGIGTNSIFELYRRTSRTVRADSAATYERQIYRTLDPNSQTTEEESTGAVTFGGSLIGFSARLDDPLISGTVAVNVKVNGVTKLTETLNTTASGTIRSSVSPGVYKLVAGDQVSVESVPTGYGNLSNITTKLRVNVACVNSAITQPAETGRTLSRPSYLGLPSYHDIDFGTEDPIAKGYSWNGTPTTALDRYATIASNPRVGSPGAHRPGYTALQPIDANFLELAKDGITLPSECWLYFRCPIAGPGLSQPTSTVNHYFILGFSDDGSGTNSINLYVGPIEWSGTDYAALHHKNTASTPNTPTGLLFNQYGGKKFTQGFIQKDGTTYYLSVGDDESWYSIGTETLAATLDRIRLVFYDDGGTPGTSIFYPHQLWFGTGKLTVLP